MNKKALITGVTGQDGAYLAKYLIEKNYQVFGAYRGSSKVNDWKLKTLCVDEKVEFVEFDLLEFSNIFRAIEKIEPDLFFNLAAQSFVSTSFEQPIITSKINALGTMRILEAVKSINKELDFTKLQYLKCLEKSSQKNRMKKYHSILEVLMESLSYSPIGQLLITEKHTICLFVLVYYLTMKVLSEEMNLLQKNCFGLTDIKFGKKDTLKLGNINTKRDWGYAKDHVEGMYKMINSNFAGDYVLATGKSYTIKEFCKITAQNLEIDLVWKGKGIGTKGVNNNTGKIIIELDSQD